MLFPAFNFASLLPLRNKPAVSTDVYPSRPRLVSSKVVNTGIAVALVDNEDGLIVENIRLSNPAPTPMSAILADVLRPHKTDGKVTKSSVAVKSVDNEDGTLIDYYTQYDGNGSTADGWPSRKSWVSFADMYVSPQLHHYADLLTSTMKV